MFVRQPAFPSRSSSVAEMISVVVSSADGEKTSLFRLSSDTTVSELKRLWEEQNQLPEGSLVRKTDGSRLGDHQQLSEIEETIPGIKTINVSIEEAIVLQIGLYKCPIEHMKPITVGLSATPEDLHPQVTHMFNLGEDRVFRLRSRHSPLMYNMSFEYQPLESGSSIFIDLGYELDLIDEWTSAVSKQLVYSSEDASELLSDDDRPQRVLLDGLQMNIHHDLIKCMPSYYQRMTHLIVHHQQQRDITLLVNDFLRQRLVWPTDSSGRVIEKCPPLRHAEIYFEDQRVSTDVSMRQLQLPDHAVVHTKTSLTVKLSNGKRKVVEVADLATVADVEAAVSTFEGTTRFMLTSQGRRLKASDRIKTISDGSCEVDRTGDTVVVHLSDRCVRFSTGQRKLRFTELVRKVAESGRLKVQKLVRTPLACQGCGRRLCLEEEAFQTVPANCCRVRSLILTDATPPKIKGECGRAVAGTRRWETGKALSVN